jgi:hypothetical protein
MSHGRSHWYYEIQADADLVNSQVYLDLPDKIIQDLDNWFDEFNMEFHICMSNLNSFDSFASCDA